MLGPGEALCPGQSSRRMAIRGVRHDSGLSRHAVGADTETAPARGELRAASSSHRPTGFLDVFVGAVSLSGAFGRAGLQVAEPIDHRQGPWARSVSAGYPKEVALGRLSVVLLDQLAAQPPAGRWPRRPTFIVDTIPQMEYWGRRCGGDPSPPPYTAFQVQRHRRRHQSEDVPPRQQAQAAWGR